MLVCLICIRQIASDPPSHFSTVQAALVWAEKREKEKNKGFLEEVAALGWCGNVESLFSFDFRGFFRQCLPKMLCTADGDCCGDRAHFAQAFSFRGGGVDKLWIKTCFFLLTFGKALENEMRDMRWLWILLLHSLLKKMWKNRKCHIFTDEM
ncbi:MAG: hypothetical protein J6S76_02210 [Clostridia bacterium]|nr:hypothetical protein [Clostridia bacterium]